MLNWWQSKERQHDGIFPFPDSFPSGYKAKFWCNNAAVVDFRFADLDERIWGPRPDCVCSRGRSWNRLLIQFHRPATFIALGVPAAFESPKRDREETHRTNFTGGKMIHGGPFLGWRRNIGMATLIMTCLLAAGWIRSFRLQDGINFPSGKYTMDSLFSLAGALVWASYDESPPEVPRPKGFFSVRFVGRPFDEPDIEWRWRWWGFGDGKLKSDSIVLRTIPYWSLITPLTLLSAWLLLFKRCKPTSKNFKRPVSFDER